MIANYSSLLPFADKPFEVHYDTKIKSGYPLSDQRVLIKTNLNAGFIYYAAYADVTVDQFDDLLNVHFKGPFFLTQKLLKHINDIGGVVNVSTGLARFSTPGFATYASMKGAIETLTRYQAQELGKRGIRSNVVAPGPIETDIMGGAVRDNKEMNANLAAQTALGRVGLPEDIGGVVAFLCTDDAKWINGQRIEISGGSNL